MKRDPYVWLGWLAMLVMPLAASINFGWVAYTGFVSRHIPGPLAVVGGVAVGIGLELLGAIAGHLAVTFYGHRDWGRLAVAGGGIVGYVAVGTIELFTVPVARFVPILAGIVYVLVGLRSDLDVTLTEQKQERAEKRLDDLEFKKLRMQYQHEERLAEIERARASTEPAPSALVPAVSGHECKKCGHGFGSVQALNAHQRHCKGAVIFSANGNIKAGQ